MELTLNPNDLQLLAEKMVQQWQGLAPAKASTDPMTDPTNWVRSADLDKHINISRATLISYVRKGKIGRAKLSGCTFYYLPDIGKLLKDHYYKSDTIDDFMGKVKKEGRVP